MVRRLLDEFSGYSTSVKVALVAVATIWTLIVVTLVTGAVLFLERPGQAQQPTPGTMLPAIKLDPAAGPPGTSASVQGQGWQPNQVVLIYLIRPGQTETPNFASAGSTADDEGRFIARFVIPSEPEWQSPGQAIILARTSEGASAQAVFLVTEPDVSPSPTLTASELPTLTPTPTPLPTATPGPTVPVATALTDLNIRTGPGTDYPVVGVLHSGQSAEVTGVSPDLGWWQVRFTGVPDGRGWVSARYVSAANTGNVPVVQPPARPPTATPTLTPTPTPTTVVIRDWRGEYFDSRNLSGNPAVVRNDSSVNFDWGAGSPAPGLPVDNFSVRWTRDFSFPAGNHRFYIRADDGVRLWIDGSLIIDEWHDASATLYTANASLTAGVHNVRVEYYEHLGNALIQLSWERIESYPDWKGEYFDNRELRGNPVLARNDASIDFDWGGGSPAASIPVDNFSVRWTRQLHFEADTYRFLVRVDDGVRLWIDGNLVIDEWHDAAPTTYSAEINLSQGSHSLRMEYFERALGALARLSWERVGNYPDWKAEYFDNRDLRGNPVLVRNETEIDHDWDRGSPSGAVPSDNFSARWTREVDLEKGTYLFRARVDDGVRVWVDDRLIIDDWRTGSARVIRAEERLSEGEHRIRVEYFERGGDALIEVDWERQQPANQPPLANPGGPYQVDEGVRVRLDGDRSRDPDGVITRYEWDLDYRGGFTVDATGRTVDTHYPDGPADVTVALRVTDDQGAVGVATTQVEVRNVAPSVEAGGPYAGVAGSPINLTGSATDPGSQDQASLTYQWEFGDGGQAAGAQVSHTYPQPGLYTATLTVTDQDGGRSSDTAQVQVRAANQPPTATIQAPPQGVVGEPVTFDAAGSSDADGQIVYYAWQFGDGTTDSGVQVTHTYANPGIYTVGLAVTDDEGLTDEASHDIRIEPQAPANQPPTAAIQAPDWAQAGQVVQFDASGSNDPDGRIVSYDWNFGDETTATGAQVTHTFAPGKYMVRLVVTDEDGLTAKAGHDILVEPQVPANRPPTAAIQAPDRTQVGRAVQFDASGSSDPDGQIVSYNWNFNGTTAEGVQVTHTFGQPGRYLVRLTVTDDGGLTAESTHGVLVEPKAPGNQPVPAISGPAQGPVGQALTFSANGSHDPDGQIVSYVWDLGDGTAGNGIVVIHTYGAPGTYLVRLTVTDDSELSAAAQHTLRVDQGPPANQPPTAVISVPTKVSVNQLVQFDGSRSSDPDGQVVDYAWSFGGGATGSGVTATHVYSQAGTYRVILTVTDNGGYTATAGQIIQVQLGPQSGVFQPSIIQGNRSRDSGRGTRR